MSYVALANYLTQMSRTGIAGSQVVAVKIDHIETVFARPTAEEFLYALTDAADNIAEGFSPYPHSGGLMGPFETRIAKRVCDCDELAGDGCYDNLVWFAGGTKTVGEGFQERVVMAGNERRLRNTVASDIS